MIEEQLILQSGGEIVTDDTEVVEAARNLEQMIVRETRAPFVKKGVLVSAIPENTQALSITTGSADELRLASNVARRLGGLGLHAVDGIGNVLFVDCQDAIQKTFPYMEESMLENRTEDMLFAARAFRLQVLQSIVMSLARNRVDLSLYPKVREYIQNVLGWEKMTIDHPGAERIIPLLTKDLARSNNPVHIFPLFTFGPDVLPLMSSIDMDKKGILETVSPEQAKANATEVAKFYVVADEICKWNSEDTREGYYGPWGRVIVAPEACFQGLKPGVSLVSQTLEETRVGITSFGVETIRGTQFRAINAFK